VQNLVHHFLGVECIVVPIGPLLLLVVVLLLLGLC
jgi:hypothetical protein